MREQPTEEQAPAEEQSPAEEQAPPVEEQASAAEQVDAAERIPRQSGPEAATGRQSVPEQQHADEPAPQPAAPQPAAPQPAAPRPAVPGQRAGRRPAPRRPDAVAGLRPVPLPRRRPRRPAPGRPTPRRVRRPKAPRSPLVGLVGLVLLTLVAAFFAWVSAEPLWLALGYGDRGTAVVSDCTGGGVGQRCVGEFTSTDGGFRVDEVAVLGVAPAQRHAGASVAARMVSPEGRGAFAGDRSALHLRWMIGVLLALACGPAIALATGAARLDGRRARLGALALSLATPPLIVAGFLANALWGWGF